MPDAGDAGPDTPEAVAPCEGVDLAADLTGPMMCAPADREPFRAKTSPDTDSASRPATAATGRLVGAARIPKTAARTR
ncbi:hypothetical protein [Streptomyces sp. NPDC017673]|uniref:hypothetical protein n=1 Tax=unclassified Streptomyces TaxID=2593676 RepID=UPI0037ADBD32